MNTSTKIELEKRNSSKNELLMKLVSAESEYSRSWIIAITGAVLVLIAAAYTDPSLLVGKVGYLVLLIGLITGAPTYIKRRKLLKELQENNKSDATNN